VVVGVIYSEAVLELYLDTLCRYAGVTEIAITPMWQYLFLNDFYSRPYIPKNQPQYNVKKKNQPQYVRNVSIYR